METSCGDGRAEGELAIGLAPRANDAGRAKGAGRAVGEAGWVGFTPGKWSAALTKGRSRFQIKPTWFIVALWNQATASASMGPLAVRVQILIWAGWMTSRQGAGPGSSHRRGDAGPAPQPRRQARASHQRMAERSGAERPARLAGETLAKARSMEGPASTISKRSL
jgi:hypothetical protein